MGRSIISKKGVYSQGDMGVYVWRDGVKVKRGGWHFVPSPEGRARRGGVYSFSPSARRRLREAMLELDLSVPSYRFGLTLTLPWKVREWGSVELDDFKSAFNRFGVSFKRAFPRWAAIFRVELQQRGAPHVHAIVYAPMCECSAFDKWWVGLRHRLWRLWFKALKEDMRGGSLFGFYAHGVSVDEIRSEGQMMRYLADHASKHKQAQLGYKGKQWGFLNRKALGRIPPLEVHKELSEAEMARFCRVLRKLCRYRVKAPCVFGNKLSRAWNVRGGLRYVSSRTAIRLVQWAKYRQ